MIPSDVQSPIDRRPRFAKRCCRNASPLVGLAAAHEVGRVLNSMCLCPSPIGSRCAGTEEPWVRQSVCFAVAQGADLAAKRGVAGARKAALRHPGQARRNRGLAQGPPAPRAVALISQAEKLMVFETRRPRSGRPHGPIGNARERRERDGVRSRDRKQRRSQGRNWRWIYGSQGPGRPPRIGSLAGR